ncbi:hypothetical protein FACS1894120_6890 [Clostridia bacterium]|nr:hypothetical protein FACS1894120_6890 [Clostridia bacterium]
MEEHIQTREEFGRTLIRGIDTSLKMAAGEIPRHHDIHEKIKEWKKLAEEEKCNESRGI